MMAQQLHLSSAIVAVLLPRARDVRIAKGTEGGEGGMDVFLDVDMAYRVQLRDAGNDIFCPRRVRWHSDNDHHRQVVVRQ